MSQPAAARAADLIAACEILAAHRSADPSAYRAVHASATAATDEVHRRALDPRGGDLDALLADYADLVRRMRELPVPPTGGASAARPIDRGAPRQGRSGADALGNLLGRAFGASSSSGASGIDALLSEVATGISPNVERAVRDGLRDLFAAKDAWSREAWSRDWAAKDPWEEPEAPAAADADADTDADDGPAGGQADDPRDGDADDGA